MYAGIGDLDIWHDWSGYGLGVMDCHQPAKGLGVRRIGC